MDKNIKKHLVITAVSVVLLAIIVGIFTRTVPTRTGQASLDGAYSYFPLASTTANTVQFVRGGAGVLGYVTVASTSPHEIIFYDVAATTSIALSNRISGLKRSVVEGTYIYEVAFRKGLAAEVPTGFMGDITISYK